MSTAIATQSTKHATNPTTEQAITTATTPLQALYGAPLPIRTKYATRFNNEMWRKEVQCPQCGTWQRFIHNAHCHRCCIDLAYVIVPAQEVA